ncbi:PREDICTED: protein SCAF11 isoform X2 [Chinchilla lanigera]|uniref:SR-related CTD associated factor 11 n=1 Tax=Chinchilla lanigera TaxID=34839 RepID=A0A8C2UPM0_CHILA|nr:PREDICTED: protein SCAF11 isoform X2 [Chinchilla lanigera]
MKKKTVCTLHMGDGEYEDAEGEGSRDNTAAAGLLYSEADRCPICLNPLLEKEVGFPECCNHVFCMTCILKWAETLASCPIDRKPFQAVFKFSALEGCIKVQVKRQLREAKDKKKESSFKKQLSCCETPEGSIRKKASIREDLLSARFYDLTLLHRNSSYNKMGGKKNAAIKIDKPRRSNQCMSYCFRNFFSDIFSSGSHSGESSFTYRAYCTEFIEVSEIGELIGQKRRELALSWSPDASPGMGRIGFIPWSVGAEVLPLISSVLPRTVFPASTLSLENFGTSCKGYALAHTQEGEEKKQTSGTSNTRGSRRKPAATPTRRSTRNTKAETVSQSQRSSSSNNAGCGAPGNSNPSVSVLSPAESEKQTKQAPKRKCVRRGRKPPVLKKKLRRSVPPPEKSPSDSVEEEIVDSDVPPVLEKEQGSDVEESSHICSVQTDTENRSANCLKSCSEQMEENEECRENHDVEQKVEPSPSESSTDAAVLAGEGQENSRLEAVAAQASTLSLEHEVSKDTAGKGGDALESQDQTPAFSESETEAVTCSNPPSDFLTCSGSEAEAQPPAPSPLGETPENAESELGEQKVVASPAVGMTGDPDAAVQTEALTESPELESAEGEVMLTVDRTTVETSEIQPLGHTKAEAAEAAAACEAAEKENLNTAQDSENNLLKNFNSKLDTSLEENTESLVEPPRSLELPNTHIGQTEKHFSEDNNEMIPMECDSLCSDQNESEIESSVSADSKQLIENSVVHSSENNVPSSSPVNEKVETVSQTSENPADTVDKSKKPRTRRSRFHSPSTTWSPNKDTVQEKKRSQSPSPKRETGKESQKSRSPSPKKESARGRRKSRSQSPKKDTTRERKYSQSRSPKRDSTKESKRSKSPSPRDTCRENRRSQSKLKDTSSRERSRSQSRERGSEREGQRRDRDGDRRARRRSRSRSRSRSPSRSRTKSKSSSFGRNERDSYSPRWKERWTSDGWRCPRGNDRYRRTDPEKQNENVRKEKNDIIPDANDPGSADKHRNDCPSWVTEKINSGPDPRTRNPEKLKDLHWEENRNEDSGNSWSKNLGSGWMSHRGRGSRGRGAHRGGLACADQSENRWQHRKPPSGNPDGSGSDALKFAEQQPYKQKSEQEFSFDTPADRSGWTSASSWAVRRTLPADVQNYYSRRGRSSSGQQSGWMRQEEPAEPDSNLKDQTNQQIDGSQLPVNMMPPQVNMIPQHMNAQHQPMNIFPYPVGVHAPLMNTQRHPYSLPPQLPLHLPPGVPLVQVAAPPTVTQGLPPPPPPPPPSQQVSYAASQPDGKLVPGIPNAPHVSNNTSTSVSPAPTAAPGNPGTVQGPSSGNTSSSSHSRASNAAVKLAESKKLQIQEKAAQEVKLAIKPFYQNKDITKEEYKEIVRKAVDKVCHSKSGEVNPTKVANLVKAYVDKYKHARKGGQKKAAEEPVPAEHSVG